MSPSKHDSNRDWAGIHLLSSGLAILMLDRLRLRRRLIASSVLICLLIICWQSCHGQSPASLSSFCDPVDGLIECDRFPVVGGERVGGTCDPTDGFQDHSCPSPPSSTSLDSLAWKKGPWRITPFGFFSGEAIASDSSLTARPFILYVNDQIDTDEKQFTVQLAEHRRTRIARTGTTRDG